MDSKNILGETNMQTHKHADTSISWIDLALGLDQLKKNFVATIWSPYLARLLLNKLPYLHITKFPAMQEFHIKVLYGNKDTPITFRMGKSEDYFTRKSLTIFTYLLIFLLQLGHMFIRTCPMFKHTDKRSFSSFLDRSPTSPSPIIVLGLWEPCLEESSEELTAALPGEF